MTSRRKINHWNPAACGHDERKLCWNILQQETLLRHWFERSSLGGSLWKQLWAHMERHLTCPVSCSWLWAARAFLASVPAWLPGVPPKWQRGASCAKHLDRCSCSFIHNDTGHVGPWVHPPLFQTQGTDRRQAQAEWTKWAGPAGVLKGRRRADLLGIWSWSKPAPIGH